LRSIAAAAPAGSKANAAYLLDASVFALDTKLLFLYHTC